MNLFALLYLILTFILGITTLFFLPLNLPRWSKYLIGPALGLIFITQCTLLVSLVIGFNILAIILTILTYASGLIWLTRKTYSKGFTLNRMKSYMKEVWEALRQYWPLWLIFVTIGAFTVYVFTNKVLTPSSGGLITGGEGLYGDTALHSAYTSSILYQGLPPKNPLFAGHALIYPFLVDFTSAILIKLGGSLNFAFSLPQIAYFLGFTTLFYLVARKFTDNRGAFFALCIFFLGWGLGFTDFLKDAYTAHSWQIVEEYTNSSGMFRLHNPLTGLIFPERSFLPGLFIGMLITLTVIASRRRSNPVRIEIAASSHQSGTPRNDNILIGLLLGILPLWHTHTFIFFGVSVGIWTIIPSLWEREGKGEFLSRIAQVFLTYSIAFLVSLPVLVWFNSQIGHGSFISFHFGWMDSGKNFVLFWWKNTGLLIPLAILGIWKLKLTKYKLFFVAPFLLFMIGNIIQFQPWDWDNIKLFTWVFLFFSIPAGHALSYLICHPEVRQLTDRGIPNEIAKRLLNRSLAFLFFLSLILSGTLSLLYFLPLTYTVYDKNDINLADWIKTHTQPSDVFLIDPWPNHPVPGLTGRSVYVGYPGHLWVHGIDYGDREQQVRKILTGEVALLQKIETPIDYITVEISHDTFSRSQDELSQVFANQKFRVYKVKIP